MAFNITTITFKHLDRPRLFSGTIPAHFFIFSLSAINIRCHTYTYIYRGGEELAWGPEYGRSGHNQQSGEHRSSIAGAGRLRDHQGSGGSLSVIQHEVQYRRWVHNTFYPEVVGLQDATILTARCTTELRRAEDEFERGDFSPGDEATVNAALVNLITVLSMLLKMRGCVHHDRTNYSILSGDRKTELYRAGVDGLILYAGKDRVNAFMEVKRDFRGRNQAVRRQIAAQMAAFIYHQDIELARQWIEHNKREGK